MATSSEEQIWTVAEAIANAFDIASSGQIILIDQEKLVEKISPVELKQILEKLVSDNKIIEILQRPSDLRVSEDNGCYGVKIINQKSFRDFLNSTHAKHFGAIDRLAGDNFFAICDVAMDISSGLQLSQDEEVTIPIVPSIIKFSSLCPAKSVALLDRYGDFRMKALMYMKEREYIFDYKIAEDMYVGRWDKEVTVWVDRFNFQKFYKKLTATYEIRVVQPAKKQKVEHPEVKEQKSPVMPQIKELTKEVIRHEHTHHFENSIQEKDIGLNQKYGEGKSSLFYISKKGDDFYYKGLHILASKKNTDYYKVFCALYAKLPEGGEVTYKDLGAEIKSRMPEQKSKNDDGMQKFIQSNLTDRNNGFMRYAKIPKTEDNGKPLISVVRGSGVVFNNKTG